jgi:hypothetical protein
VLEKLVGWRRKEDGGVNAVIRIYFGKPIEYSAK